MGEQSSTDINNSIELVPVNVVKDISDHTQNHNVSDGVLSSSLLASLLLKEKK